MRGKARDSPFPHTEVSIRGLAEDAAVPLGAVGEICARGYLNMLGYNDQPDATARTIDASGWLHTGDLGTMDARGYVRITGRVKDMIIRGGENLFPAEIENVLIEHADVAECAVVGTPDPYWGEVAIAFLRARRRSRWFVLDAFALTGSGKIQKFVLRERLLAGDYAAHELHA